MKTAAVIAEYNPFHNGHLYQLQKTRESVAEAVVTVMSGNFVQRGDLAVCKKQTRALQALQNGADLVLELPLPWAAANAQTFAYGAVSIIDALGFVDALSFGCECGSLLPLRQAVAAMKDERILAIIKEQMDKGAAFASAREHAIEAVFGAETAKAVAEPNNTLAVEYLTALEKLQSSIEPLAIARVGAEHDSLSGSDCIASASHIRQMILSGKNPDCFLPPSSKGLFDSGDEVAVAQRLEISILSALRRLSADDIKLAPDISEGLENRIYAAIRASSTLPELFENIKTRRYTMARIRRIILSLYLGITSADSQGEPPYVKILGFNKKGRELLALAKNSRIKLVSSKPEIEALGERAKKLYSLECLASDLWVQALGKPLECGTEMTEKIIVLE